MTAEIVIMNKEAVALAADSAVTSRLAIGQKIFTSANKYSFTLSDCHPVGILIYNNAALMEIPWETIIELFRNELAKKKFDKLEEYADYFISFIENKNGLFPEEIQKRYLFSFLYGYFIAMKNEMEQKVESVIKEHGSINDKMIEQVVAGVIESHLNKWVETKPEPPTSISLDASKETMDQESAILEEAIKKAFQKLPISKKAFNQILECAIQLNSKAINNDMMSGVVITGFGDKELFPSLKSFIVEGVANNKLKYRVEHAGHIDFNKRGWVTAFAQREMVVRFMEGVDPAYKQASEGYISELFSQFAVKIAENAPKLSISEKEQFKSQLLEASKSLAKDYLDKMSKFSQSQFVNPVTTIISVLPKRELATLAESLVSLTVLKRKFSAEAETVSEPIDVALISRQDGFVWIIRSHTLENSPNG